MKIINLGAWVSRLRVGQKIGLGYGVALGVAVSGTIAGFATGHYHQQQSFYWTMHVRREAELLHRLQIEVLHVRTHQQQLIPLMDNLSQLQHEYEEFQRHTHHFEKDWAALKNYVQTKPTHLDQRQTQSFPEFLTSHDGTAEQYIQALDRQIKTIQSQKLDSESARRLLLKFTNSELALRFDAISDDLVDLIAQTDTEQQASDAMQVQAELLSQRIVVVGIVLSIALSVLLALWTSRSIARPIRALTKVAQRSTEDSNFELQATVSNQDEIGALAIAFNHLITSVRHLLQEQQMANQQLEQRVSERTQELSYKNNQLQELLNELHRTQMQIVQSEKMSALGQMVAGVAHEINNPVNFIHGNLSHVDHYAQDLLNLMQAYQTHYPTPPRSLQDQIDAIDLEFLTEDFAKVLQSIQIGTERIREIVLSLRNFSRLDEAEFKTADLHEGIENTLMILQHRLKAKKGKAEIQVIRDYQALPQVECYPGQLNQVVMNLLANAIDAIEDQPDPTIWIWTRKMGEERVEIAIADNGCGIPEEIQNKLFDPFFTTKPVGKGTGLGLSISHQIVTERHHGRLSCCSAPGEGTKFVIDLPVRQAMG